MVKKSFLGQSCDDLPFDIKSLRMLRSFKIARNHNIKKLHKMTIVKRLDVFLSYTGFPSLLYPLFQYENTLEHHIWSGDLIFDPNFFLSLSTLHMSYLVDPKYHIQYCWFDIWSEFFLSLSTLHMSYLVDPKYHIQDSNVI